MGEDAIYASVLPGINIKERINNMNNTLVLQGVDKEQKIYKEITPG